MRMTLGEYEIYKARTKTKNPVLKRNPTSKPLAKAKIKEENTSRSVVRVTSYRCRETDPDNLFCKWAIDGLRYAHLIPDDSGKHIELHVSQVKVKKKSEERTEIEVIK